MTKLYHEAVGFPANLKPWRRTLTLRATHHAQRASASDRYGAFQLPKALPCGAVRPFEIAVTDGRIEKAAYRLPYDARFDVTVVVMWPGVIVSAWLNERTDTHATLNPSRYTNPKEV